MSFDELYGLIADSSWFTRIGEPYDGCILANTSDDDDWGWLPTARDQADPIHGDSLALRNSSSELSAVKQVLASLRAVPDTVPALKKGPHDYSNAAKGGAQFAARYAAREITNDSQGFWCEACRLFYLGYWPCGVTEKSQVVVW